MIAITGGPGPYRTPGVCRAPPAAARDSDWLRADGTSPAYGDPQVANKSASPLVFTFPCTCSAHRCALQENGSAVVAAI